jgi:hypothetical protein
MWRTYIYQKNTSKKTVPRIFGIIPAVFVHEDRPLIAWNHIRSAAELLINSGGIVRAIKQNMDDWIYATQGWTNRVQLDKVMLLWSRD